MQCSSDCFVNNSDNLLYFYLAVSAIIPPIQNIFCVRAVLCIDIVNSYLFVMENIENGLEAAKGTGEGSLS